MIKIIFFVTGSQIFYIGGLIFYAFSKGTKACVTAADLMDLDENLHCITRPLSSCDIKISVVSQCRIIVAVQYMSTGLFASFFSTESLHLLDCSQCSVTSSLLTRTDADGTC